MDKLNINFHVFLVAVVGKGTASGVTHTGLMKWTRLICLKNRHLSKNILIFSSFHECEHLALI